MKKFLLAFCIASSSLFVFTEETVSDIFKPNYKNQLFMNIEAALAEAQSDLGIIPVWASEEISSKANFGNKCDTFCGCYASASCCVHGDGASNDCWSSSKSSQNS